MTHTPTPWILSETCDHRPSIMDANGHNIVSWDPTTIELFGDPRPDIIKACNAHEELVAIVQRIVVWERDPDRYNGDLANIARDAHAVIAKAEGKGTL